jgi:hypothetical protein
VLITAPTDALVTIKSKVNQTFTNRNLKFHNLQITE